MTFVRLVVGDDKELLSIAAMTLSIIATATPIVGIAVAAM